MDTHTAAAGHGVPALQRQHDVLSLYGGEVSPRGARHRLQVSSKGIGDSIRSMVNPLSLLFFRQMQNSQFGGHRSESRGSRARR